VRAEYVLAVRGQVRRRPPGTENPQMATGEVEVATTELEILNTARALPFYPRMLRVLMKPCACATAYLDLRRQESWHIFIMRHRATAIIRDFFIKEGFSGYGNPHVNTQHSGGCQGLPGSQSCAPR